MTAQQPSRCIAAFLLVLAGLVLGGNLPAAAAQVPAGGPATYIYDGTDDPSVQTHPLTAAASRTHSARLARAVAFNAEHTSTAATGFAANTEEGLVGAGRSLGPGAAHVSDPAFGGGFDAPSTFLTRDGELSNGSYTVSSAKMAPHMTGSLAAGKSQFLYWVDAQTAALDAASYADEAGLWVGNKATVFIENGPVGVLGNTGELTDWLNIYRTDTGFIHASPGNGP